MKSIWIKICGITNIEDALKAVELGVDALGFVFYEKSPRKITKEKAKEIIDKIQMPVSPGILGKAGTITNNQDTITKQRVVKVGVFVDELEEKVNEIASYCNFDILQFHGDETPDYCKKFPQKIIKAFRIKDKESLANIPKYEVDYYLLDAYSKAMPGGTGRTFNWDLAREAKKFGKPIILSGGLNPENIVEAIERVSPFGVDVSSGVELSPGKKDHKRLKEFITKVRDFKC
ncbi:phosphoribosylanthranilate isomerase [bacterium]|nr:phosphoribosylanthranilate isomerase [bacterium]MBU4310462.1 phosphoribosylanthranilate isomerase [bacterium]MCG2676790.1 phosphoribosylanthranilate isomerase [bacterium]MCG2678149.1 phosphoribosylanthranilate isomerase [bacterium]